MKTDIITVRYIRAHRLFQNGKKTALFRRLERDGWRLPECSAQKSIPSILLHSFNPARFEIVHNRFL